MADEINRASPRTQSALLQAMQEKEVSVAGQRRILPRPFHVLATQNPIEQEGTYPLPEAQLDRFLLQIDVDYPDRAAEREIILATTGVEDAVAEPVFDAASLMAAQMLIRRLPVGEQVVERILDLVRVGAARPGRARGGARRGELGAGAAGRPGADAGDPSAGADPGAACAGAGRRGGAGASGADPPHGAGLRGAGRGADADRPDRAAGERHHGPGGGGVIEPRRARGRDKPQGPVGLRRDAEKVAGALPPLLAQAELLAATVAMGFHGRRRAGHGENFWQYRQAVPGDPRSSVDWRRSGKSDQQFIREMEWEAAQTVSIWVDDALSMDYRDAEHFKARSKNERASLWRWRSRCCFIKAGERVALMGTDAAQPRTGRAQLNRMAMALGTERTDGAARPDYGAPPTDRLVHAVAGGVLLGLPRRHRGAEAGAGPCRRPGGAGLLRAGAGRDRGNLSLRRPDDLPERGAHRRVRDPAGAGAARPPTRSGWRSDGRRSSSYARHLGWRWYFHDTTARRAGRCSGSTWRWGSGRDAMIGSVALPLAVAAGLGFVALPVLWWLLRAVPPAPGRRIFPGVRLLLGLQDPEKMPERTPWWLLALRMLALAAAILAFAGPVLNPRPAATGDPLLVLIDGGWGDAPDWTRRVDRAAAALDEAARTGRQAAVVTMATPPLAGEALPWRTGGEWRERLAGLAPRPGRRTGRRGRRGSRRRRAPSRPCGWRTGSAMAARRSWHGRCWRMGR